MDLEPLDLLLFELVGRLAKRFDLSTTRVDELLRDYGLRESRVKKRETAPRGIGRPSIYAVVAPCRPNDDLIKIGYSAWPFMRIHEIQDACPVGLDVYGVYAHPKARRIEEDLQCALRPELHHGDWLRFTPRVRGFLVRLQTMADAHKANTRVLASTRAR